MAAIFNLVAMLDFGIPYVNLKDMSILDLVAYLVNYLYITGYKL